jgi:single-stranded DNA-binding protein
MAIHKVKIELTGYLARTPEIKTAKSGKHYVTFSLGVSELDKSSPKDERGYHKTKTRWYNMTAFNADVVEYFSQCGYGMELKVGGEVTWDTWTPTGGQPKETLKVIVTEVLPGATMAANIGVGVNNSNNSSNFNTNRQTANKLESDMIPF